MALLLVCVDFFVNFINFDLQIDNFLFNNFNFLIEPCDIRIDFACFSTDFISTVVLVHENHGQHDESGHDEYKVKCTCF